LYGTILPAKPYPVMTDPLEDILVPAAVELALSIYESFSERQRADIVQAHKALTAMLPV
jgi:hypothetical protein